MTGADEPTRVIGLQLPMRGLMVARNSPASRVPSHGTELFATAQALDLVPVDDRGRTAPVGLRALLFPQRPEEFPGFGREVLSPAPGIVHAVHDGEADHPAHRGLPSLRYALTQSRRAAAGWASLAGNHVLIRLGPPQDRVFLALCHLRRGSIEVVPGETVETGRLLARCGNSGNSTEPHLHLQLMDHADPATATPVAFDLPGGLPRDGGLLGEP